MDKTDAVSSKLCEDSDMNAFEMRDLERRCLNAEKGNDFAWNDFDKPYFVFIHDDSNAYLSEYANIFLSKNVPFGAATIVENLDDSKISLLHRVVSDGGEVLAHYNASPTESSSDEEWLACTRDVKMKLEKLGFSVRGIIRANSTGTSTNKGEKYCRRYFDYANDKFGRSTQYDLPRTLMLSFDSLSEFKARLDTDLHSNGIHAYGFHGGRSDEQWITADAMAEIIDYVTSHGGVITTYSNLFDTFGTTVLEKKLSVPENR